MKAKEIFITTMFLCCIISNSVFSQDGLIQEDYIALNTAVEGIYGDKYQRTGITKVDSAIGNLYVSNGQIEDPYNTLKGCLIFNVKGISQDSYTPKGFIGIYRNGQVIWHSDTLIYCEDTIGGYTFATRDLNNDGKVEIITIWSTGYQRHAPRYMWIFSWDGQSGYLVNDVDSKGQSTIWSDYFGGFDFVDVNGDGVFEIQGWRTQDDADPKTYSSNGQLYGEWPDTPQPNENAFLPRDKVDVSVRSNVEKIINEFNYRYIIESRPTSIQNIDEIKIAHKIIEILKSTSRRGWRRFENSLFVSWSNNSHPPNFIVPGEIDTSFSYKSTGLPKILPYYIRGHNKTPTGRSGEDKLHDLLTNSATGFTIGAADPPDPFIASDFLDTLMTYPDRAYGLGWIDNKGIANSLDAKLDNAKKQLEKGKTKTAVNVLNAFLNELEAQKDKHINSEAYVLLKYNAEYLIERLE